MGWLFESLSKIHEIWEKHKAKILGLIAFLGGIFGLSGIFSSHMGQKIDKEAKSINENAIREYKESNEITTDVLEKLGELQIDVCESFPRWSSVLEKINYSQRGSLHIIDKIELAQFNPKELIELSNTVKVAVEGAVGSGTGIAVGIAAFGANAVALAPGAFAGGVVLCVTGAKVLKKSIKNKHDAIKNKEEIEKILKYHTELRTAAESLYGSMNRINDLYIDRLEKIEEMLVTKTKKRKFTAEEKLLIKNTGKLVKLLYDMCKVELVNKASNEKTIETVNTKEVNKLVKTGDELIAASFTL